MIIKPKVRSQVAARSSQLSEDEGEVDTELSPKMQYLMRMMIDPEADEDVALESIIDEVPTELPSEAEVVEESFSRAEWKANRQRLREEEELNEKNPVGLRQQIVAYSQDVDEAEWDANGFLDWCESHNVKANKIDEFADAIPDDGFGNFVNRIVGESGERFGAAPKRSAGGRREGEPKLIKEPSPELQSFMGEFGSAAEIVETAEDTVYEKYHTLESRMKRTITGRTAKNYFVVFGDPGIGKSYTVEEILKQCNMWDYVESEGTYYSGTVGTSKTAITEFLWKNKDKEIIILDDCDSMISKAVKGEVPNMLKAAMEGRHIVSVDNGVRNTLNKKIKAAAADSAKNEAVKRFSKGKKLFQEDAAAVDQISDWIFDNDLQDKDPAKIVSYLEKNFPINDLDLGQYTLLDIVEDLIDGYDPGERPDMVGGDFEEIPQKFQFNARIIFISNLDFNDITPALISRCDHYGLYLTKEEYLVRLALVVKTINVPIKGADPKLIAMARTESHRCLCMAIAAADANVPLFGKTVAINHPLEFRIIKSLMSDFVRRMEDWCDENNSKNYAQAEKAIMRNFMRIDLIPNL